MKIGLRRNFFEVWLQLPMHSRIAAALVITTAAGIPLAVAPGIVLEHDVTPKLVVLLCCVAGLLCCWNSWWRGATVLLDDHTGRWFFRLLGLQALSLAISTAFSQSPGLSLAGSPWRRYGFVTQLALAMLSVLCASIIADQPAILKPVLLALVCSSGLVASYAIMQFVGWDPLYPQDLYSVSYYGGLVRAPGTLGHALYLGAFLSATIPITLGLATQAGAKQRAALWAIAGLSLIALVLSGSRSALVALLAAGLAYLLAGGKLPPRHALTIAGIAALFGIAILAFVNLRPGNPFVLRMTQWRRDFYGGPRLLVWRNSLALIPAHLATGYGPETFANEFRRRQSKELAQAYPDFYHESPHNILIDATTAQGIPGLLVCAGLLWLAFSRGPVATELPWLRSSVAATFVSLLFVTVTISGAFMLYFTVAIIIGGRIPPGVLVGGSCRLRVKMAASAAAMVLLAASAAYIRQDRAMQNIAEAVRRHSLEGAVNSYHAAIGLRFPASGDDLWASRQFATLAQQVGDPRASTAWETAAMASAKAERSSDTRGDALYQSAVLALSMNDPVTGERKLRQAIEAAPYWYKPHLLLAQFLNVTHRDAESESEARQALDLAGKPGANIQQILR